MTEDHGGRYTLLEGEGLLGWYAYRRACDHSHVRVPRSSDTLFLFVAVDTVDSCCSRRHSRPLTVASRTQRRCQLSTQISVSAVVCADSDGHSRLRQPIAAVDGSGHSRLQQ
jgi:hypothetical protein